MGVAEIRMGDMAGLAGATRKWLAEILADSGRAPRPDPGATTGVRPEVAARPVLTGIGMGSGSAPTDADAVNTGEAGVAVGPETAATGGPRATADMGRRKAVRRGEPYQTE